MKSVIVALVIVVVASVVTPVTLSVERLAVEPTNAP